MKKRKLLTLYNTFYPMLLLIATFFMGICYASINSVSLNVDGSAIAKKQNGIFISEINYSGSVSANIDNSDVLKVYQTMFNSDIYLSNTDGNSSITYSITIYNTTNDIYYFDKVNYILGNDTYSNQNIIFTLDGLKEDDILNSNSSKTFEITFSYKDKKIASSNNLKSYLTFKFNELVIDNVGGLSGGYSASVNSSNIEGYQNLTKDNFFFEVSQIVVPEEAFGTMTFTKSYNSSTGVFTITRSSLDGTGIITFSGNIYASTEATLVGSGTGGYTINIDCTSVNNWQNKTKDDFALDLRWVEIPDKATGTMSFAKTYNSSTGVLTVTRSAIQGTGLITFLIDVYALTF